eukprot:TRINITY_DN19580_c0_g1_i1.p1 TRINITY_DN19580_c0_g1~~TRINITY_DN19580_c0_g1_i1.p1  ORF type:complete len:202 (-),score=37.48 TRINITY_DN19580_c0_g1_i1:193-798(-)
MASSLDVLFSVCFILTLPVWILLIFAPLWRGTLVLIRSMAVPLLLSGFYLVGLFLSAADSAKEGEYFSLDDATRLLQSRAALLAFSIQYFVLSLFVGSWITLNAREVNIPHIVVAPILLLTFFFAPIGLLLYFLLARCLMNKSLLIEFRPLDSDTRARKAWLGDGRYWRDVVQCKTERQRDLERAHAFDDELQYSLKLDYE